MSGGKLALTLPNDIPLAVAGEPTAKSMDRSLHYSEDSRFGSFPDSD